MLRNILVIAAVVGLSASMARADLEPGDPIDINGFFDGQAVWGSQFEEAHPFGGFSEYTEFFLGTSIFVLSFELEPPKGKKFAGQIDIRYEDMYLTGDPHVEIIEISGIKEPGGENFINTVEVLGKLGGFSSIGTDGFNITIEVESVLIDVFGDNMVSIAWTQVPAPGTLALLGLAGLLGTGRRRRQ